MVSNELRKVLNNMDIPSHRKTNPSRHNLQWLKKNLAKRNSNHPNIVQAMNLINAAIASQ